MTIANCPRCREQVSVPDSASHEATVQCPFCQDEYSLAEAIAQLPPSLIVVSDFGQAPATAVANEDDSPWSALNLDDDASPAAAFDFASGSATAGGKSTGAVRPGSRSRKPQGSPIKSVLSIVIGGLLAFPIAQLILWYLPGDWKRDFGAGPIVAQYVPQIVPAKFRGNKADAEPSTQDSGSIVPEFDFRGSGAFGGESGSSDENVNAKNKQANSSEKKRNTSDIAASNVEPPAEEQMSLDDAGAVGEDLFGSSLEVPGLELGELPSIDVPVPPIELSNVPPETTEEPSSEFPSPDDTPRTLVARQSEVASLAPGNIRNAPQVSADDVVKSVQAASSGNLAWDTDEASSPSVALKKEFYLSFSKLGEALTFADRADKEVVTQIAETAKLLQEVGKQPDKLAVIGGVANGWIAAAREIRMTDGICLYGVVKSVGPIGNFFETTVESGNQQIAVVSMSDPSEYFAENRQVLILGTILDNPAKNLGGYEGSRAVVVLDGFHTNVSAE